MKNPEGFAYIVLLVSLSAVMLVLTAAAESEATKAKREREQQLFFVGKQFYSAIASYYENSPNGAKQFPKRLNDLLIDKRSTKTARHLRMIFRDPMTNDLNWGLVKNQQKQIIGVYSLSAEQLMKTNVDTRFVMLSDKQRAPIYSDLHFIYQAKGK